MCFPEDMSTCFLIRPYKVLKYAPIYNLNVLLHSVPPPFTAVAYLQNMTYAQVRSPCTFPAFFR